MSRYRYIKFLFCVTQALLCEWMWLTVINNICDQIHFVMNNESNPQIVVNALLIGSKACRPKIIKIRLPPN